MKKKILVTGGAGFIGSHLGRELLQAGYAVRAFDNLDPQVHGELASRPQYLPPGVELVRGDVRDPIAVRHALEDIDAVFHFAAALGVGQSMYRIADYTSVNDLGTACLLEAIVENPIEKLIVASSMSIYGEGEYVDADGRHQDSPRRTPASLEECDWEPRDSIGRPLEPRPTSEKKPPAVESIYAVGKLAQEQAALIVGRAYDIPVVSLRMFNVYGPNQALSNPYTGVVPIFAARLMNNRPPVIFEDGGQRRDFVHVHDVVRACRLALEVERADGGIFNIGSGKSHSVREVAHGIARVLGRGHLQPEITHQYRAGDVRHCFADITRARTVLGFEPRIALADGLEQMSEWLTTQVAVDHVTRAHNELHDRGLTL